MKIGNVSGVYLNYPIEEAVRRIAAAGYDSIDVWSGRPHVYTLYQTNFDGVLSAELGYHYTLEPDPAVQLTAQRLRRVLQAAA